MSMQTGSIDADGLARTSDGKLYVTLGSGTVLDPSAVVFGAEDTITAFATGGQTSATALSATKTFHRVSVCATAADSVKLPAATVGQAHYLRNDGAAAMQVFGQATETINGVASATGISQAVGMGVWYVCTTAGAWTTGPVSAIAATTKFLAPDGVTGTPTYSFTNSPATGMWSRTTSILSFSGNSTNIVEFTAGGVILAAASVFAFNSTTLGSGSTDIIVARAGANSLRFSQGAATTASRTEINKATSAIANAVATTVLTVTVPNAAHSASLEVRVTGSLGTGGAIGANEATATNTYVIGITRTPGVATVATATAAFGAVAVAVAGAATVTATAAVTAMTGAVGATQTFDIQVTISRSGGSSDNHTCLTYAKLMNANVSGITLL